MSKSKEEQSQEWMKEPDMKLEKTIEVLKQLEARYRNATYFANDRTIRLCSDQEEALTHAISVLECRLKHDQPCHCWKESTNAK